MLKNKKKLRRMERNTPGYAVKTAQSLVLAGALVLGGAGMAVAAADSLNIVTNGNSWAAPAVDAGANQSMTGAIGGKTVGTSAAGTVTFGTLTINGSLATPGANDVAATLNVKHSLSFGNVSVLGTAADAANRGGFATLNISGGTANVVFGGGSLAITAGAGNGGAAVVGGNSMFVLGAAADTKTHTYNAMDAVTVTGGAGGATNTAASAGGTAEMKITGGLTAGTADAIFNGNDKGLTITGGNTVAGSNAGSNGGDSSVTLTGTTATAAGIGGGAHYNNAGAVNILGGNDVIAAPAAGNASLGVTGGAGGNAGLMGGVAEMTATSIAVKSGAVTAPGNTGGTATLNVIGGLGAANAGSHAGSAKVTTGSLTVDGVGGAVNITGGNAAAAAANGTGGNASVIVGGDFTQTGGKVTVMSGGISGGAVNGVGLLSVTGDATINKGELALGQANGGGVVALGATGLKMGTAADATAANTKLTVTAGDNKIYGNVDLDKAKLTLTAGSLEVLTTDMNSSKRGTVSITNATELTGAAGKLMAGTLDVKGNVIKSIAASTLVAIEVNKLQLVGATTLGQAADNGNQSITITGTGKTAEFLAGGDLTITGNSATNTASLTLLGAGTTQNNILLLGKGALADTALLVGAGGQTNPTDMFVKGITVGNAGDFGTLTLAGAVGPNTTTLEVGTLTLGNNGAVNVGNNSTLIMGNALSIATNMLTNTSATAGKIAVDTNGVLYAKGGLTLTGAATAVGTIAGEIIAPTVTVDNNGAAGILTWNGNATSKLTLLGAAGGGEFLNANTAALDVQAGTVNLGTTAAGFTTVGGVSTKNVAVTHANGTLNVAAGDWQINQLNVSAGKATISGNLTIGDATSITALQSAAAGDGITGNNVPPTVGINVVGSGSLSANHKTLVLSDFTAIAVGLNKIWLDNAATLKVTGYDTIKLSEAKMLYGAVVAGTGLVSYGDATTITLADGDIWQAADNKAFLTGTVKSTAIDATGVVLTGKTVGFVGSVTTGGYGADNLKSDATTGTVTVTLNNTLTLLGKAGGVDLVQTNGATATDFVIAGNALNLGNAFTAAGTSGTLNGTVQMNTGGSLNVTNGTYVVKDITTLTANNGSVNVNSGSLTTGKIGVSGTALDVKMAGGVLNATGEAFIDVADITGGVLASTGAGVAGNLTIGSFSQTINGAATAGKISNAGVSAAGNFVLSASGIDANNVGFDIAGNMTATDQTLTADKSILNVGGLLSTGTGNVTLMESAGTIGQLTTTGILSLNHGSNITLSATDTTTKASSVATLNVGEAVVTGTAGSGSAANLDVKGKLSVTAGGGIYNGSTVTVNELDATGTILVGSKDDTKGSSLIINKLTANSTGTFFVDPATENSIVQVKDTTTALTQDFIAGNNGIVSFGERGLEWTKAQIAESGMTKPSVLVLASPVTLNGGAQILVGDKYNQTGQWDSTTATADAYGLAIRGNSLVIADATNWAADVTGITLAGTVAGERNVLIEKTTGLRLYADNLKAGETRTLVSGIGQAEQVAGTALADKANLAFEGGKSTNYMLIGVGDVVYNTGATNTGFITASTTLINATSVLPKLSQSMGTFLDGMATNPGFNSESENAGIRFVSRALDRRFLGVNDPQKAAATIEGAAQMAAVAGVQVSTIGAASVASGAVTTRTSFAQPLMDMTKAVAVHQDNDGALSLDTGLNAGNGMKNGLGVWIMPLYQSNKTWGQKAENFKSGMNSDLGGIALGADYTINDMFRFGAAFNVGAGYGQSTGDFNKTENRFNFWGVNLYGGWTMNNYGLSADVGYTSTFNAVKQDTPASLQMGNLKSDVTSSALQAGLKAEYKLETSVVDIIPHVGVRYMGLATDGYDVKSHGTVFSVERDFQSIWTFPIGVAFSKTITSDSGWMFKPMVDLSVVPAAGDIKAKSKTSIPGVGGQAEMKMQVVDTVTFDGGLGFEVGKDNLSFGLNYNVQASEHRTGHGVFGTLRYEF